MKKIFFKLILTYSITFCSPQILYSQDYGSCHNIIDSIKQENDNQKNGTALKRYIPRRWKYFITGIGTGYFDNINSKLLALEFFGNQMWQINDFLSLGFSGDLFTEFEKTVLINVAFTSMYYPIYTSIIPFSALSLGPGLLHDNKENRPGGFSSFEIGAILPELLPFVILLSAKLNIFVSSRLPAPLVYTLRAGAIF